MSITTTRSGDIGNNFTEQVIGQTPCSVAIDQNAKGAAQVSIKLTYETPDDMRVHVADQLAAIIDQVKAALSAAGIPLAGQTTGEGK